MLRMVLLFTAILRETIDWEKEAKKTVKLDIESKGRRKTIYELDSHMSFGPSVDDIMRLSTTDFETEPQKRIQYSISMGVSGIARINLTPLTQKVVGCVIGENVSTEYPWVYVRKEIIEDNIDLHEESSDFLPVKDEIREFPDARILIGYVPSLTQEAQFYICLTKEGQDAVVEHIQKQREEHENRVRTAVYKPLGVWEELGSSVEIEANIVRNTRPLLEIELVSTADVLNASLDLEDRKADDQLDGYIELLPYRQVFENVSRKLLYNATQVTPTMRDTKAQTALSMPTNSWNQYGYEYTSPDISTFSEEQRESFKSFLRRFTDEVCDEILINATWDIYTNDYWNLVRDVRDTQWTVPAAYKEHLSFHDGVHVSERVINDLRWHPLWTGIFFAAYTRYSKCHRLLGPKPQDKVMKAYKDNCVLVWSFTDSLSPKLILDCPREVTTVDVNPIDPTLIIGGCSNGQVVLWHVPGKIEQIEAVAVSTPAQVKYRLIIRNLSRWLREVYGTSTISPTAMSSLKDSQKATITKISWISAYDKVDENGRITSLPEDTSVDDLTLQFVTSSEDGTIAFWDLKLVEQKKFEQESRLIAKKKMTTGRPEMLKPVSPFKHLDRILRPHYVLVIQHPDVSRRHVITTLSIYVPTFEKKRVDVAPPSKDITIRRVFENIVKKPEFETKARILVGTVEGDFGCVTWEGFEFTTDMAINSETCSWSWYNKVHDGPITHAIRCKSNKNIVATVGGKVFCVWRNDFDTPLISKKSNVGYTAFSWGSFRSTVVILSRMDGSVEIWDFMIKSEEPCIVQSLSGRLITGVYTHELYLDPQCVGICDFNGTFRVFLAPVIFLAHDKTNEQWMNNYIERQYQRIKICKNWQNAWTKAHSDSIKQKQMLAQHIAEMKQLEEEKARTRIAVTETAETEAKQKPPKPWEIIEAARERWKEMELKRMQQVILEKKGLRKDELERQREPILRMRHEARRKKKRLQETLDMQEEIFEHSVNLFFPKREPEGKRVSLTSTMELHAKQTKKDRLADTILQQEVLQVSKEGVDIIDPDEEIVQKFMETEAEALAYLQQNPFVHTFNWRKVLDEGKARRYSMDYKLHRVPKLRRKSINST
ncbi:dynein axonemal intermediate chain 3-like [Hylaeus volcanicus]|uniref:dynein axonemal intermediate chain 3-like n=1 Tax=Hylaeus volcanicus TaxID=313075 RepID=UPI0023B7FF52|nr:dynein axonemal intermediate chain 3-like [Hylaeus volcanicus]